MAELKCTYCGGTDFFKGPEGGISVNLLCANPECRHWFNHTLEDLLRIEPTDQEKYEKRMKKLLDASNAKLARYEEGRQAFLQGRSIDTLRTDPSYVDISTLGYEPTTNMDRISGFLDAMSEAARCFLHAMSESIDAMSKATQPKLKD